MFPSWDQLNQPKIPVAKKSLDTRWLTAEISILNRGRKRTLELLFSFCGPSVKERFIVLAVRLNGNLQAPRKGYRISETRGDPLSANFKALVVIRCDQRVSNCTYKEERHVLRHHTEGLYQGTICYSFSRRRRTVLIEYTQRNLSAKPHLEKDCS